MPADPAGDRRALARGRLVAQRELEVGEHTPLVAREPHQPGRAPEPGPEHAGTTIEWMSLLPRSAPDAAEDAPPLELLPMPCFHCDNPPCVKVCPVNATYKNEEGLVVQIWDRCIGCRYCTVACPYERRSFNWTHTEWPEEHRSFMNPDVALRPEGVVEKCTFCSHRIRKAREQARLEGRVLADEELQDLPACAESCPAEAIVFGDRNDAASDVAEKRRDPRHYHVLEELNVLPSVGYLRKVRNRQGESHHG